MPAEVQVTYLWCNLFTMPDLDQIKKAGYQFIWREFGALPLFVDTVLGKTFRVKDEKIIIYRQPAAEGYISSKGLKTAEKKGEQFYNNWPVVKKFIKKTNKIAPQFKKFIEKIENSDLTKKNDRELLHRFKEFLVFATKVFKLYNTTEPRFAGSSERKLSNYLSKRNNREVKRYLKILLTPDISKTIFNQQKLEWLNLVLMAEGSVTDFSDKIARYQKRYAFLANVTGKIFYGSSYFLNLFKKDIAQPKKFILKKLESIKKRDSEVKYQRRQLEKELNLPSEIVNLSNSLREIGLLRLNLDPYWRYALAIAFKKFLPEIAERKSLDLDQVGALTYAELRNLLLKNTKPNLKVINQRKSKYVAIMVKQGIYRFLTGHVTDRYIKVLKPKLDKSLTMFKGGVGNPGYKKGKVKIIHSSEGDIIEEMKTMKKGQILVTEMTRPQLIMAIHKAGAIITDEGGMTSHAAIISREFNIPCIIGTKIATQVLKDGDMVEVDADKGIVKIIDK